MAGKIRQKAAKRRSRAVKQVKVAQGASEWERPQMKMVSQGVNPQRNFSRDKWRVLRGNTVEFQGIQVFAPVDPYRSVERKEFRSAMTNPYVYRASRIQATMTVGQGYTTTVVPRIEEDVPEDQLESWGHTEEFEVPGLPNRKFTAEQIKDKVDKMAIDHDLATNVFNAYMTAIEQGRCVLALTPLETDEQGQFFMPESIRLIRPEFTERPVLNEDTSELEGVRIIGVRSPTRDNILPKGRMIYIMYWLHH